MFAGMLGFCCVGEREDGVSQIPHMELCESYSHASVFKSGESDLRYMNDDAGFRNFQGAPGLFNDPSDFLEKPGVFNAELDMAVGVSLGMLLDNTDDDHGPMIIDITDDGMVSRYNESRSYGPQIELFDRIEAVNGRPVFGASSELALKKAAKGPKVNLLLRKPMKLEVALDKSSGKPVGANMTYKKGSYGLLIKSIHEEGLFKDWNETVGSEIESHEYIAVSSGDRVVGMLGEDIKSNELVAVMKRKTQFTLTVMHY